MESDHLNLQKNVNYLGAKISIGKKLMREHW